VPCTDVAKGFQIGRHHLSATDRVSRGVVLTNHARHVLLDVTVAGCGLHRQRMLPGGRRRTVRAVALGPGSANAIFGEVMQVMDNYCLRGDACRE
jgi:hypothetical protein